MTQQQQDTELHSNESSVCNTTDVIADELLCLTPMSCRRSRRSSKTHDEPIGSFLYPPNPFGFGGLYKKSSGRKSSFLSRRHSDSLLPAHYNQYHVDYGLDLRNGNHHHCHRGHGHNHQSSKCFALKLTDHPISINFNYLTSNIYLLLK